MSESEGVFLVNALIITALLVAGLYFAKSPAK